MLVQHLPPESAYITAVRNTMSAEDYANMPETKEHQAWSHESMLLASIVEAVRDLTWLQANKGVDTSKGQRRSPYPERIRRPGVENEQKKGLSLYEMEEIEAKRQRRNQKIQIEQARQRALEMMNS